ncbi:MAG: hypothetical protein JW798_07560 [Prolixibacteraceae bacterium]|nr:hypothetical protein [Prolixibacteraceae bacterium]
MLVLLAFFSFIFACEQPKCEYSGVYVNCGFYHFDGTTLQDTLFDSLSIFVSIDPDTAWLDKTGKQVGSVQLPLSMVNDTSMFIFSFDSLLYDTLVFFHTKELHLVSHACGFINFFEITDIESTKHNLDSIWIRKSLIEYGEEENIKIYF